MTAATMFDRAGALALAFRSFGAGAAPQEALNHRRSLATRSCRVELPTSTSRGRARRYGRAPRLRTTIRSAPADDRRLAVDSFSPRVTRAEGMTRARVGESLGGGADACWSQLLDRSPHASGEIAVDIRVSPRGTTIADDLLRDDVNDAELASCIRRVVLPIVWGDASRDGGTASVVWSVVAPGTTAQNGARTVRDPSPKWESHAMRRLMRMASCALTLAAAACEHPSTAPSATSSAASSFGVPGRPQPPSAGAPSASVAPSSAAADASQDDAAFCLAHGPANLPPHAERCHWRAPMLGYCGGPAPRRDQVRPRRSCVCDLCSSDADCAAGHLGRCLLLPSRSFCESEERVCVYAGDACDPAGPGCGHGQVCTHGDGRASCFAPPAAPM